MAHIQQNEEEVGIALKDSGVPRKDIWLTSKVSRCMYWWDIRLSTLQLWNSFHDPRDVESALDKSLEMLGTDYLDLYVIHWPFTLNRDGSLYNKELTENPYPTWQKLEELVDRGKIRNIGVSKCVHFT